MKTIILSNLANIQLLSVSHFAPFHAPVYNSTKTKIRYNEKILSIIENFKMHFYNVILRLLNSTKINFLHQSSRSWKWQEVFFSFFPSLIQLNFGTLYLWHLTAEQYEILFWYWRPLKGIHSQIFVKIVRFFILIEHFLYSPKLNILDTFT